MKITWIEPVQLVENELRQIEEEGRDSTGLRRRWIGLTSAAASPEILRREAFVFLDELTATAAIPADTIDELSTLEALLQHAANRP